MTKKPIVIYHGNCADGFAAAWCFWDRHRDSYDYFPGVYQEPPPDVSGRHVYLVDFSYKRAVVEDMLRVAKTVTLIDHHKTALEDLANMDWITFQAYTDLERSGATLAWDFLHPEGKPRPRLLEHIEDRDLWRFKLPDTRRIQSALFSYEYDFQTWAYLMTSGEKDLHALATAGAAIDRKHLKDIRELLKVCKRRMLIAGHDVPVASLPYTYVSDAAHEMAQGEPFAACYWDTAENRTFGLRSAETGIDVSEVAKQYGGGGHKHAAGFSVPRTHALALI